MLVLENFAKASDEPLLSDAQAQIHTIGDELRALNLEHEDEHEDD